MRDASDAPSGPEALQSDGFPDGLSAGSAVLVASAGDPSQTAICLHTICRYGDADDTALIVTTTESADRTIESSERVCTEPDRPSLGIVDTTSEQQSVTALYGEPPVVFTPGPADLERLVMALSDLSRNAAPSRGDRHLAVRSLTPVLQATSTKRGSSILGRITGLRSEMGLCLLGLDYTAHDEETMRAMADHADGVLWVTQPSSNQFDLEYRAARGRSVRPPMGGDTDD